MTTPPVPATSTRPPPIPPTTGAFASGVHRNLLQEWNPALSDAEIQAKLDRFWESLFASTDDDRRVYYPFGSNADGPMASIVDIGNGDVRSEGLSYGMMIAVQMDRQAEFDALWNFARSQMQRQAGPWKGYFAWRLGTDGAVLHPYSAPDAEQYFAMALFFAAGRWGNRGGIYDYAAEANAILDAMLHKEEMNGGVVDGVTNIFDRTHKMVVFVPHTEVADFTDPSYHLPAFYELWARWAAGYQGQQAADRQFWLDAAATSRAFFGQAAHAATGLCPDYATFAGAPHFSHDHDDFRYDAWRAVANWSVDYAWWARDPNETALSDRLQTFFASQGLSKYATLYALDGQPRSTDHAPGLVACNAVGSLAATQRQAWDFVGELWKLEPPTGKWRYYDGLLTFLGLLHASGRFRIHAPRP